MALLPENFPGEKLLMKLWETITEKGVGGLLAPWQVKRLGRARTEVRRDELLVLAQAEKDIEDIRAGRKYLGVDGKLLEVPKPSNDKPPNILGFMVAQIPTQPVQSLEDLIREGTGQFGLREAKRAINIQRILLLAEQEAERVPDSEVSEKQVENDWFERWRENAQDVSSDELRQLWARVLSGEVKQPGTFSLHLLELLRRISRTDAESICKIAPYVIDGGWIFRRDYSFFSERGFRFSFFLDLEELGILTGTQILPNVGGLKWEQRSISDDSFLAILKNHGKALIIESPDPKRRLEIPIVGVTRVGKEILSLGDFEPNVEYLEYIGRYFKSMNFGVSLNDYERLADGAGRFTRSREL